MPHHLNSPKFYVVIISIISIIAAGVIIAGITKNILFTFADLGNKKSIAELETENQELKKQLLRLRLILLSRKELINENERLKEMLRIKKQSAYRLKAALVIDANAWQWSRQIRINKGTDANIKTGQLVIDSEKNLVGKIEKTSKNQSWVMLISDPDFKAIVKCRGLKTVLVGSLFEGAKLLYVPNDFVAEKGDPVTVQTPTKGMYDITAGKVTFINKNPNALTQDIFVKPSAELTDLKEIFVITE